MNWKSTICLLVSFIGSIASAPLQVEPTGTSGTTGTSPPLSEHLEPPEIYSRILTANTGYCTKSRNILVSDGDVLSKVSSRLATSCTSCLWPKSEDGLVRVPFNINLIGFSDSNLALINNAMEEYETLTCARFVNWTTESDYLEISSTEGCLSYIGRIGGVQSVLLASPGCMQRGIIQHELLHALGFQHENARSDRDGYIIVRTEFVIPEFLSNFNVAEGNTLGLPYDYGSVMHYDKYAFTIDPNEPTIIPTPNPNVQIGQAYGLSVLDVQKMNKFYNCAVCSNLLNEIKGNVSLISAEYPHMTCVWLIRVPYGQVNLTFTYFDIQHTDGCVTNFVRIYDGPTKNYPLLLDRACGTVQYPTIISSTDQMLIEFTNDGSVPSAGFNASYKSVPCGGFYSGAVRTIASPGYNTGEYPPNLNCFYTVYAPVGYRILLSGKCELEDPLQGLCFHDILYVYSGGLVGSQKSSYCGKRSIPTRTSLANQMLLNFVSDRSKQYKGFLVTYEFVPE